MDDTETPQKITLLINFFPATGEVTVTGPIQNRQFCYGLLKMAEKSIDEAFQRQRMPIPVSQRDLARFAGLELLKKQ